MHKTTMKKRRQTTRAFTMIELMVTIAVSSVVMVALTLLLGTVTHQWSGQVSRGRAIQIANFAMSQISREARGAVLFQAVDGTKTCTFTMPANTDASGNFVPVWNRTFLRYAAGYRVHYYLSDLTGVAGSGSVLWRETNPLSSGSAGWVQDSAWSLVPGSLVGGVLTSSARGKMDNITALTFSTTITKPNTVQASITVSFQEGKTTSAYTLARTIYLGNHN
jgi:prepilin-type N-terminal cleavage/methylation domain-containing protein